MNPHDFESDSDSDLIFKLKPSGLRELLQEWERGMMYQFDELKKKNPRKTLQEAIGESRSWRISIH